MSKAGKSLFYFGIYVLVTGIVIIFSPGTFITALKLSGISSGWATVIGLLAMIIGIYDIIYCSTFLIAAFQVHSTEDDGTIALKPLLVIR